MEKDIGLGFNVRGKSIKNSELRITNYLRVGGSISGNTGSGEALYEALDTHRTINNTSGNTPS